MNDRMEAMRVRVERAAGEQWANFQQHAQFPGRCPDPLHSFFVGLVNSRLATTEKVEVLKKASEAVGRAGRDFERVRKTTEEESG